MSAAWSEVFAILDRAGGWMLEERSRPSPALAPTANVGDSDEFSSRAAAVASRYGDVVRATYGHSRRWTTFLGDSVVVRLAGDARGTPRDPLLFDRVLTVASLPGGPVVLECDPVNGVLVESRHSGHVLDRVWFDMTHEARSRVGEEVAAFRTALASVEVSEETVTEARRELEVHVWEVFGGELAAWAWSRLDGELRWRHADLHAENILVEPSTGELSAVVDWEWARVSVAPVDQARLYGVTSYQVGMPWAAAVAGPITPGALLAAFALQCIPRGHERGSQEFYDSILEQAERFALDDVK